VRQLNNRSDVPIVCLKLSDFTHFDFVVSVVSGNIAGNYFPDFVFFPALTVSSSAFLQRYRIQAMKLTARVCYQV